MSRTLPIEYDIILHYLLSQETIHCRIGMRHLSRHLPHQTLLFFLMKWFGVFFSFLIVFFFRASKILRLLECHFFLAASSSSISYDYNAIIAAFPLLLFSFFYASLFLWWRHNHFRNFFQFFLNADDDFDIDGWASSQVNDSMTPLEVYSWVS